MRFSIYSEIQSWPEKSAERQYADMVEEIEHADRMGYYAVSIIEHFFFPNFSISANPLAFFASVKHRTERIRFRTLLHSLPFHNPAVLASQIAAADILLDGRYEFGVGRGHGWLPPKAGMPVGEAKPRYDEALEILFKALENERFSHEGTFWNIDDGRLAPGVRPGRTFRVFLGGTSDSTYELAGRRGWAICVPPLLPYPVLEAPLNVYREACAANGNEPDILWIHACHLDDDGELARREGELGVRRLLLGNTSPLPEMAPAEELQAAGFGFYTAGILEGLADMPYEKLIDDDYVWVGTPDEVADRIQATKDVCEGLTEVAILANAGGTEHWKAIKTQELFADRVIPRFTSEPRPRAAEAQAPLQAGA
jgi:alkanesulfonate monooxygenase SsuD/methylene tetrahydromethanopterin reductase-like flavin-dependent oxidoreductase (luciferase family)